MAVTAICSLIAFIIVVIWHIAMAEERAKRRRDAQARRAARAVRPERPRPRRYVEPVLGASTEKGRQLQREMLRTRQEPQNNGPVVRRPRRGAEPEDAVPPGFQPRPR